MPTTLKIGMIVFPKGQIVPQLYRIADVMGDVADLKPISLGAVPMQSPTEELRRYRIRSTDEVAWEDHLVRVIRATNPESNDLYKYEIEAGDNTAEVPEYELAPGEGSLAPDPIDMIAQRDIAPWKLASARIRLLEAFFNATARSMGIVGYNGARMLPIPHQINAARYALQFGRTRFLLADEVGLGKTVEAGLIVNTLRKYFSHWKAAIFVPESLTAQWAFEMYGKFGKLVFNLDEEEDEEDDIGLILPHERARAYAIKNQPEILVVDEAHRILQDERLVQAFTRLSKNAHAVLLLTATPVSDDARNLLRLFNILDPREYGGLDSPEQMRALRQAEAKIEILLKTIRQDASEPEEIAKAWKETGLEDEEITELITGDGESSTSRHRLHRAASLAVDRYYPGARMLRYRRKFLEKEVPLPFRVVDTIEYKTTPEEAKVLKSVRLWMDLLRDGKQADNVSAQRVASALIQAAHSSPLALETWIAARRGSLERHAGVTADPVLLARRAMENLDSMPDEDKLLDEMSKLAARWKRASRAVDATLRHLARSARFEAFLKFLHTTFADDPDSHILVFTGFEVNVHPIYLLLKKALTDTAELFEMSALRSRIDREKAAFEFQEFPGGSVLISDELGGEGRNFQFATHVVHFDLPLAPWTVEQRIGRCDRVGRSEELDVDSQVLVAKGQLDEAYFDFLADGVGVFNESIAPVEGELDRINSGALKACIDNGATGVLDLIEETAEFLEQARERENTELLVRDSVGVEEAQRIAKECKDDKELAELRKHSIHYLRLFDSMIDEQDNERVAITVGEFHSLHGLPGILPEMIGYFDRTHAVRHERMEFFSPGHPLIRTAAQLAMMESPDRAAIVQRKGVSEPTLLCVFRVSIPADFFPAVRELSIEMQPPLLSKSARLFATQILPVAVTLEGKILSGKQHPAFGLEYQEGDSCLYGKRLLSAKLPDDWAGKAEELAWKAQDEAERIVEETLPQRREEFENLVCEVFTRVHPSQKLIEPEIEAIVEHFDALSIDIEAAVLFLPKD